MAESENSRPMLKLKARWCEHAERYEDMVKVMVELVKGSDGPLDEEERNLLSVAYKNVVGIRRTSWRMISGKLNDEKEEKFIALCKDMKNRVEKELNDCCKDVLNLLDEYLLPKAPKDDVQAEIFYLKMKGDYYRYMVEILDENDADSKTKLTGEAHSSYSKAMEIAQEKLESTSPIRLGLALNFSVFYYEIMDDPKQACSIAQKAFDDAIAGLDNVPEDVYKDSTLIMQLLRDNLTLWKSENDDED